jgi:hypothetical protein
MPPVTDSATALAASSSIDALATGGHININSKAFTRGLRALLGDAISNASRAASGVARHAVTAAEAQAKPTADENGSEPLGPGYLFAFEALRKGCERAATDTALAALWAARAVCYASANPLSRWAAPGRVALTALADPGGLAAGGAVIERYARDILDIILKAN